MSLHIDDVFVPKLARKICRIYSELTAFFARYYGSIKSNITEENNVTDTHDRKQK